MNWEYDRGGRDTLFYVDGRVYRAGARSTRCFRDIQSQFSEADALATAMKAISLMPEVDRRFPRDEVPRPQMKADEEPVIVVALLLAGGLDSELATRVADTIYTKADGSTQLASHGFRPPSG